MKRMLVLTLAGLLALVLSSGCRVRREAARATMTAQAQALLTAQVPAPEATALPTTGPAVVPEAGGALLFFDDFQDGLADRWQVSAAWDVQQQGNLYYFASAGPGAAWVPQGNGWDDYVFRAAARLDTGSLAFYFRLTRDGRYMLYLRGDGTYLVRERPAGNYEVLGQAGPLTQGALHWIVLAGEGGHLQAYADRTLLLDYTDPAPLLRGTIGVATAEGSQAAVDNVHVARLTASLPAASGLAPVAVADPVELDLPEIVGPPAEALPPPGEVAGPPPEEEAPAGASAQVSFTVEGAESATIDAGQCVTVEWSVENALEVYYQGLPVTGHEFRDECPEQTTTYTLEVVHPDGATTTHAVTVTVNGGPPVSGQPALSISVTLSNAAPAVNERITVTMSVVNEGGATAEDFDVVLLSTYESGGPNNPFGVQRLDALAPGESASVQMETFYPNPGQYTLRALVTDAWYANGSPEPGSTGDAVDVSVTVGEAEGEPLPEGQPDLLISAAAIGPNSPMVGQPVTVYVVVFNGGEAAAGAFTVRWHPNTSEPAACNWDLGGLAVGAWSPTLECTYAFGAAGDYNWRAVADAEGDIAEADEGNNEYPGVLTIPVGAAPDLVIEGIELTADDTVRCDIRNIGTADAPAGIQVTLFYNSTFVDRKGVGPGIPAGTANSIWYTAAFVRPFDARCVADYTEMVAEANEDNNELEVTIP